MKISAFPLLGVLSVTAISISDAGAIVALGPAVPTNVALNKPTFGDVAFGAPTARGNDGITGATQPGNWTHADYPTSATPYPGEVGNAPNAYWEVDLQGSFTIDQMIVSDRADCCTPNRLNGATITLFDAGGGIVGTESIAGLPDSNPGAATTADFSTTYANVARVRIDSPQQFFQFSEFEAIANVAQPINWALGASAGYFNSVDAAVDSWGGLPATNITDGVPSSISHPLDMNSAGYYAQVDLGQEVNIDNIALTGRIGCCPERLENYTIEFRDGLGGLVHTITHPGQTTTTETIDVIGSFGGNGPLAQFVRVINTNGDNYGPQIGELEVFGYVPEPSSSLLALAGLSLLFRRRR